MDRRLPPRVPVSPPFSGNNTSSVTPYGAIPEGVCNMVNLGFLKAPVDGSLCSVCPLLIAEEHVFVVFRAKVEPRSKTKNALPKLLDSVAYFTYTW